MRVTQSLWHSRFAFNRPKLLLVIWLFCIQSCDQKKTTEHHLLATPPKEPLSIQISAVPDSLWETSLQNAYTSTEDSLTNLDPRLRTKAGACKACFMNIEYRIHHTLLSPEDTLHSKIALNLTSMADGIFNPEDTLSKLLIPPVRDSISMTLKEYINEDKREKITTGITDFILDTLEKTYQGQGRGKFIFAVGIAARHHLTHLFVDYKSSNQVSWYLFDYYGLFGKRQAPLLPLTNDKFINNTKEVEAYYKKCLDHAVRKYQKSPTLKHPTTAYGQQWPSNDRPLYAEIYVISL